MALDNRRDPGVETSTGEPFDWFTDVTRTDLSSDADSENAELRQPAGPPRQDVGGLVARYQRLPIWVVIPQLLLAFAWARSGLAHLLRGDWWNGTEVTEFLAATNGLGVGGHRFLLEVFIEPLPAVTAVVVLAMELTIAALLLQSHRVMHALGLAAFLNVQLILAGEAYPSLFFLLAAIGIGIWRLETSATARFLNRLTGAALVVGIAVIAFLIPAVRSFGPDAALEDPALMLILLTILTMVALWWINRRVAAAELTLAELIDDHPQPVRTPAHTEPSLRTVSVSLVVAAAIFLFGVAFVGQGDGGDEAGLDDGQSAAPVPISDGEPTVGSLEAPYPQGLEVNLSYNDLGRNENHVWRIQILEASVEDDGQVGARVRLSYDGGGSQGPVDQLQFAVVSPSGESSPAGADACRNTVDGLAGDDLAVGTSTEGWICWSAPTEDAAQLVMAVGAEPADGVLYMDIGR